MRPTLNYVAIWNKANKKGTWSGTTWNLEQALEKDFKVNSVEKSRNRVFEKLISLSDNFFYKLHINYKFYMHFLNLEAVYRRLNTRKTKHQLKIGDVLQVWDVVDVANSSLYVDLTFGSIRFLNQRYPNSFGQSNFENLNSIVLKKKIDVQATFLDNQKYIFTMSHWLRNYLIENEHRPATQVIYAGGGVSDLIPIQELPRKKMHQLIFVGRDFERKGGFLLIKAFNLLKKKPGFEDLSLLIIGPQEQPNMISDPHIHFLGPQNHQTIMTKIAESSLFVMPSIFEAYGIVFAEAICLGTPILGSDRMEMPFFTDKNRYGLVWDLQRIETLVHLIKEILSNDSYQYSISRDMVSNRQFYSWENISKRISCYLQKSAK
ncbi:glycosyltransferase family 4 protein [Oenococcus oeni]